MQHYGLILADNGSNWYFGGTADPAWPAVPGRRAQAGAGQRVRGGRRVLADGQPRLGPGPADGSRRPLLPRSGLPAGGRRTAGSTRSASPSTARWAATALNRPIVGMASTPDGRRLLAGGLRRRHLQPSATPPSTARWAACPSTGRSWAWPPPPTAAATGWWPPTAASSPSATPPSTARWAACPSTEPIVGMAATPDGRRLLAGGLRRRDLRLRRRRLPRLDGRRCPSTGRSWAWPPPRTAAATGWWPPTAASSPSGTPRFYGSMGGIPLNQPIVGMASTAGRARLLAGGLRRRRLHLRLGELPGIGRGDRRSTRPSWAWAAEQPPTGAGGPSRTGPHFPVDTYFSIIRTWTGSQ